MTHQRTKLLSIITTGLFVLCLPVLASAQGNYDPYGQGRGRDDGYNQRNRNNNRYDTRYVRDSASRLKDLSKQLQKDLDWELDHNRENGSRHEDHLNEQAKEFYRAAERLRDRVGNARDLYRSENEAQQVLSLGSSLGRNIQHHLGSQRLANDWYQVDREMRVIANAYGFSYSGYDGRYGRRDDDNRRQPPTQRRIEDIFRRIP